MTDMVPPTMRLAALSSASGYTVATMEQPVELVGRALVVVVDDRSAHGEEDHSGPLVTELLTEAGFVVDGVVVVAADEIEIRNALNTAVIGGVDLVVSVGGTGVTPRDVTPEATVDILDRELLGIAEALRASGLSAGHHRRRPLPRPGGHFREHPGGQHRRLASGGSGRHGHPESAGAARSSASCPASTSDRRAGVTALNPGDSLRNSQTSLGAQCCVKVAVNCGNQ